MPLTLIINKEVPVGAKVTVQALMPKMLVCISKRRSCIYLNRTRVKKFIHVENHAKNALRRYEKDSLKLLIKYDKMYRDIANKKPLYISNRPKVV